MDYVTQNC